MDLGPAEHGHRPAVDPLFRSVAVEYGEAGCGVVLSGTRDDGAAGLAEVKDHGGVALAQDPAEADYDGMPLAAAERVHVDGVLPVDGIVAALGDLVRGRYPSSLSTHRPPPREPARSPEPLVISCPECGGPISEEVSAGTLRFRCHVGHAFGPSSLESSQEESTERAVWAAVRALDDRARLLRRLARRAHESARPEMAHAYGLRADRAEQQVRLVRSALLEIGAGSPEPEGADG